MIPGIIIGALALSIVSAGAMDVAESIQDMSYRKKNEELRAKMELEVHEARMERLRLENKRIRRLHQSVIDLEPSAPLLELPQYDCMSQPVLTMLQNEPCYSQQPLLENPMSILELMRARTQFQPAQSTVQNSMYYPQQPLQATMQSGPYYPCQPMQANIQNTLSALQQALDRPLGNGMTMRQLLQEILDMPTQGTSLNAQSLTAQVTQQQNGIKIE